MLSGGHNAPRPMNTLESVSQKKRQPYVNLGRGITYEQYYDEIDPHLTRPLTLGGIKRRPLTELTEACSPLSEVQVRVGQRVKVTRRSGVPSL